MIAEARVFIDTNVLIYARDETSGEKRRLAQRWLERLSEQDRMVLNLQVLNELAHWVLRKEKAALGAARDSIDMLREFGEAPLLPADSDLAWHVRQAMGYQWFDCLLVASAANAGCTHFLSEDLGHGARYRGLTIINPFRVDPDAFLKAN